MGYLKGGMNQNAHASVYNNAKLLRTNMTKQETILWSKLRNGQIKGLRFRRQHPINIYILDFYCSLKKISIELDGIGHDFNIEYDLIRTKYLNDLGINELRFKNEEVENEIEKVMDTIKAACD